RLLLVLYHLTKDSWDEWPLLLRRGLTLFLVTLGWSFFRLQTLSDMRAWYEAAFMHVGWPLATVATNSIKPLIILVLMGSVITQGFPIASSFCWFKNLDWRLQTALGF